MPKPTALATRALRGTLLIVGEGYAEVELLRYLRASYTHGRSGLAITIKNARGKGAGHVIQSVIRQSAQSAFDRKAALLDADDGWTPTIQALAQRKRIDVVASSPCLEAWLLDITRRSGQRSTAEHKREFERHFGQPAHRLNFRDHFPREVLDAERARVEPLALLLGLMGV
jgi:hypothetical protein